MVLSTDWFPMSQLMVGLTKILPAFQMVSLLLAQAHVISSTTHRIVLHSSNLSWVFSISNTTTGCKQLVAPETNALSLSSLLVLELNWVLTVIPTIHKLSPTKTHGEGGSAGLVIIVRTEVVPQRILFVGIRADVSPINTWIFSQTELGSMVM
jgi:hypothetical protein